MSVEFSNQPNYSRKPIAVTQKKTFADKLVAWGIAKDTKKANTILTIAAVLFFAISIAVWIF